MVFARISAARSAVVAAIVALSISSAAAQHHGVFGAQIPGGGSCTGAGCFLPSSQDLVAASAARAPLAATAIAGARPPIVGGGSCTGAGCFLPSSQDLVAASAARGPLAASAVAGANAPIVGGGGCTGPGCPRAVMTPTAASNFPGIDRELRGGITTPGFCWGPGCAPPNLPPSQFPGLNEITMPGTCTGTGCAPPGVVPGGIPVAPAPFPPLTSPGWPFGRSGGLVPSLPAAAAVRSSSAVDTTGSGTCIGTGCFLDSSSATPAAAAAPPKVAVGTCPGVGCGTVSPSSAATSPGWPFGTRTETVAPNVTQLSAAPSTTPQAFTGTPAAPPPDEATRLVKVSNSSKPGGFEMLVHGASPQSFDSGLDDCDFPFEQLPSCSKNTTSDSGDRCERYARSQFTEIVLLKIFNSAGNQWEPLCTATLVSPQWALLAAHCFLGTDSAASGGADVVLEGAAVAGYRVFADNVMTLEPAERERKLKRAIVYGRYGGAQTLNTNKEVFFDDLALIQLDMAYPAEAVEPARLASAGGFTPEATIAGYGYSDSRGGTLGHFNLTWPPLLRPGGTQFTFVPGQNSPHKSAFCQGDSGGPVLALRNRGCHSTDKVPEYRPRYIQGVISWNRLARPSDGSPAMLWAKACMSSTEMAMQDVTIPYRRDWVCLKTNLEAGGC
jgi:hypothetical protein